MARTDKEPYAPSTADRPTGANRSKHASMCLHEVVRMQIANVSARDCGTTDVQAPPKLSGR